MPQVLFLIGLVSATKNIVEILIIDYTLGKLRSVFPKLTNFVSFFNPKI